MKGTEYVPFFFQGMENGEQLSQVRQFTEQLLEGSPELFLVEIRIRPTANIKVFIDGDRGVTIDQLAGINRSLYRIILASGIFPGDDFSLEVSSPGLDEPLKLIRQYRRNLGRRIEVMLRDGSRKEGTLVGVDEPGILIETKETKSPVAGKMEIPFDLIGQTKVIVEFKNQTNGKH